MTWTRPGTLLRYSPEPMVITPLRSRLFSTAAPMVCSLMLNKVCHHPSSVRIGTARQGQAPYLCRLRIAGPAIVFRSPSVSAYTMPINCFRQTAGTTRHSTTLPGGRPWGATSIGGFPSSTARRCTRLSKIRTLPGGVLTRMGASATEAPRKCRLFAFATGLH
jgi:hypothetical protein